MKKILLSVHPEYCKLIFSGIKTIEVRRTCPKLEPPFEVYVYQTKFKVGRGKINDILNDMRNFVYGGSKVIGSFVCDRVEEYTFSGYNARYRINDVDLMKTCLNFPELIAYGKGKILYGWHITEPKLFDKPKEFYELYAPCKKNKQTADESCKGCVYAYKGTTTGEIYCDNALIRPPQSFCYVESINEI